MRRHSFWIWCFWSYYHHHRVWAWVCSGKAQQRQKLIIIVIIIISRAFSPFCLVWISLHFPKVRCFLSTLGLRPLLSSARRWRIKSSNWEARLQENHPESAFLPYPAACCVWVSRSTWIEWRRVTHLFRGKDWVYSWHLPIQRPRGLLYCCHFLSESIRWQFGGESSVILNTVSC